MSRVNQRWMRLCGALLVLCLLLPLAICLCAHDDECAGAPCTSCACVCFHHGPLAVTSDDLNLAPAGLFVLAAPPVAPERALLLTAAIFRPPIA